MEEETEIQEVQEYISVCKLCKTELPLSNLEKDAIIRCPKCGTYNNNTEIIESEPEKFAAIPDIRIKWQRLGEWIPFANSTLIHLTIGIRGSGKSSLLEALAIRCPKIFDLYGSTDCECLCWLKPQFTKVWFSMHGFAPRILLIIGEDKEVLCSKNDNVTTCHANDLSLSYFENFDIITTAEPFFGSEEDYYGALGYLINILWKQRMGWHEIWAITVREASNWIYSRNRVIKDDQGSKKEFLKAVRESRHHGISMMLDSLRWVGIEKEVRDVSDYIWFKRVGGMGLPEDMWYLYRYWMPLSMLQLKPRAFGISTAKGSIGFGVFDEISWHKGERENIFQTLGIEIKDVDKPVPDERNYNLGSFEHAEIIQTYFKTQSIEKTSTDIARSFRTVQNHIAQHNASVKQLKKCMKCFNAKSEYATKFVEKSHIGRPTKEEVVEHEQKSELLEPQITEPNKKKTRIFEAANLD